MYKIPLWLENVYKKSIQKHVQKSYSIKNCVQKKMYKNTEDKITRSRLIILFEKSDF